MNDANISRCLLKTQSTNVLHGLTQFSFFPSSNGIFSAKIDQILLFFMFKRHFFDRKRSNIDKIGIFQKIGRISAYNARFLIQSEPCMWIEFLLKLVHFGEIPASNGPIQPIFLNSASPNYLSPILMVLCRRESDDETAPKSIQQWRRWMQYYDLMKAR